MKKNVSTLLVCNISVIEKNELWTSTNKTKQKIVTVNRASLSFLFLKKVAIVDKEIKI